MFADSGSVLLDRNYSAIVYNDQADYIITLYLHRM